MASEITRFSRLIRDENGATVIEYAVLVALIVAVVLAVIIILGAQINDGFQMFSDSLKAHGVNPPAPE